MATEAITATETAVLMATHLQATELIVDMEDTQVLPMPNLPMATTPSLPTEDMDLEVSASTLAATQPLLISEPATTEDLLTLEPATTLAHMLAHTQAWPK